MQSLDSHCLCHFILAVAFALSLVLSTRVVESADIISMIPASFKNPFLARWFWLFPFEDGVDVFLQAQELTLGVHVSPDGIVNITPVKHSVMSP